MANDHIAQAAQEAAKKNQQEEELRLENKKEQERRLVAQLAPRLFDGLEIQRNEAGAYIVGGVELRANTYGRHLYAVKACPKCGEELLSYDIVDLASLGNALTNDSHWQYHYCAQEEKEEAESQEPLEQRLVAVLKEFMDSRVAPY